MNTHKLLTKSALFVSALFIANTAFAADCTKDEAYSMYAKVNDHAASLKADAEANPSKIPFQSGKNDPRLKKSVKISGKTKKINKDHLKTEQYGEACESLTALAKKYKIALGDEQKAGFTAKQGIKAAGNARSLKESLDEKKDR